MLNLISFKEFASQENELNERLIVLNNGQKFNQILILVGGAGSGKGFALKNFIDSTNFKVRDVDEVKKMVQKLSSMGKINIDKLKKSKNGIDVIDNLSTNDLKLFNSVISQIGNDLSMLSLKEPSHVFTLHIVVDMLGWKNKTTKLLNDVTDKKSDHKPNIVFDVTGKNMKSIDDITNFADKTGYEPKNIHIVWILTDYKIAVENNMSRDRVVPNDIVLQTHNGAADTMTDILTGLNFPRIDGSIWVILNNKENTIFWRSGDNKLKKTKEFFKDNQDKQKLTSKINQKSYDKIYGIGAWAKRNGRENGNGSASKEQFVIKSFMRINAKRTGKRIGDGVLPLQNQLFNLILSNIPNEKGSSFTKRKIFGSILGKL